MSTITEQSIQTLDDAMQAIAPFAGGSIPDVSDTEYSDWKRWIINAQETYAKRGFWRRLLKRKTIVLDTEETYLPDDFNRPNALYVLDVDGVDWAEPDNTDEVVIFVEKDLDLYLSDDVTPNTNFGKWRIVFNSDIDNKTATLWYYCNPPAPEDTTDKLVLPGDMVAFGALAEYYRTTGAEGSQDKAEEDAENRFNTYMSLEVIPPKYELLHFATRSTTRRIDHLKVAKNRYYRTNRNIQG